MTEDLLARIRKAYPSGMIYDPDETIFDSTERDERLIRAINSIRSQCPLELCVQPFDKPAYEIVFTEKGHPAFEEWVLMGNPDKLAWIESNDKQPYPAFWIKVSRVADYYYCFYNHWVPRGDSGYLDADCRIEPNASWKQFEVVIKNELNANGFEYLSDDIAIEEVTSVLEHDYDSIPDDDPRWDDDDFEPPLVPCTISKLLFKR